MLAFVVLAVSSPAAFAKDQGSNIACGTTIMQSTTLSGDVGPCSGNGIVIGSGYVQLNCAGHRVEGTSSSGVGIGTQQSGVTIVNCDVQGFGTGFASFSGSDNTFVHNTAERNRMNGFVVVGGSFESFTNNVASDNGKDGFVISFGDGSRLTNNKATDNTANGISVYFSSHNVLVNNEAHGNGQVGIGVLGSYNNLTNNKAMQNQQQGFELMYAFNNTLINNHAENNNLNGFTIYRSSGNIFQNNAGNSNNYRGFFDATTGGTGTSSTRNIYTHNQCNGDKFGGSNPAALCSSDNGHDSDNGQSPGNGHGPRA